MIVAVLLIVVLAATNIIVMRNEQADKQRAHELELAKIEHA